MPTSDKQPIVKVAVPNKGSLSEQAITMLRDAGFRQRSESKELITFDDVNQVEFYYLRPRDIAIYVGEGTLDLGITGRDMLVDSGATAQELLALGFGRSEFRLAAPAAEVAAGLDLQALSGLRIATSYPGLVEGFLQRNQISARLIHLDGATESAVRLGVADAIADVVETGLTLRQNGLSLFGPSLLTSEAILITGTNREPGEQLDMLVRRLNGVLMARNFVLLDYHVAADNLAAATVITPGAESPTVSDLTKPGWLAVRVMVPRAQMHLIMDALLGVGARSILASDIAACRI